MKKIYIYIYIYIVQLKIGTEGFSGKIGSQGRRHSEQEGRSRSLCRQPNRLISTNAQKCQSLFDLISDSKVKKKYYYYKFKMHNRLTNST